MKKLLIVVLIFFCICNITFSEDLGKGESQWDYIFDIWTAGIIGVDFRFDFFDMYLHHNITNIGLKTTFLYYSYSFPYEEKSINLIRFTLYWNIFDVDDPRFHFPGPYVYVKPSIIDIKFNDSNGFVFEAGAKLHHGFFGIEAGYRNDIWKTSSCFYV